MCILTMCQIRVSHKIKYEGNIIIYAQCWQCCSVKIGSIWLLCLTCAVQWVRSSRQANSCSYSNITEAEWRKWSSIRHSAADSWLSLRENVQDTLHFKFVWTNLFVFQNVICCPLNNLLVFCSSSARLLNDIKAVPLAWLLLCALKQPNYKEKSGYSRHQTMSRVLQ